MTARAATAVTSAEVTSALVALGLEGRTVCVHASLRSFGRIEGGAGGVIDGVLAAGCTLLVPTSTFRSSMAARPPQRPPLPFNAEDDGSLPSPGTTPWTGFLTESTCVDPAMGAIPAAVLRRPGRRRGAHPLSSFTALGPDAGAAVAGQRPCDPYVPLQELAGHRGAVVCMGVGLTALTLLHLAEQQAGLPLLRRWALMGDGRIAETVQGGCSRGFERLAGAVRGAERRVAVGESAWRVFDAAALLEAASARFREDPGAGVCDVPGCARCRDRLAWGRG